VVLYESRAGFLVSVKIIFLADQGCILSIIWEYVTVGLQMELFGERQYRILERRDSRGSGVQSEFYLRWWNGTETPARHTQY